MAKRRADTSDTGNARAGARRGRQGQKHEPDWAPAFLAAFAEFGIVTAACGEAGISRQTAYKRREDDELFARLWTDVETVTTERMEAEARRRAVEGWVEREEFETVRNKETGELERHPSVIVRKYSDTLLMFMLKARRPDTYRERVEHTGAGGGPIEHRARLDLRKLTDEQLAALEAIQPDAGADES